MIKLATLQSAEDDVDHGDWLIEIQVNTFLLQPEANMYLLGFL